MKLNKLVRIALLSLTLSLFAPALSYGQGCPMCKAGVESTLKNNPGGRKTGTGLNTGIMVLFLMPYTAAMVVGILWYRNTKRKKAGSRYDG